MKKVALNATTMHTMETNNDVNPISNREGKECKKSCSAYREVRIDKNTKIEDDEEIKPTASDITNIVNQNFLRNIGVPSLSSPPGTVKAAANITVAIKVETSMQEFAVFLIHASPSLRRS